MIVTTTDNSSVGINGGDLQDGHGNKLGKISRTFSVIHGEAADVTGAQLLSLASQPGVVAVTIDAPVVQDAVVIPPQVWPVSAGISALPAAASAPAIAIVDSGVAKGQAFGSRLAANIDLTSTGTNGGQGDAYGHGTLVAGIAASSSLAYPGGAPSARLISIQVVHSDGSALTSDVIAAADWIYTHRAQYGIRVANFSLHSSASASAVDDPLDRAVRRLWLTGTVVVAAAGNSGPGPMVYAPASDPFVITVGAVGTGSTPSPNDDVAAPWSSFGYTADGFAKPELVAPGRMMVGPVPANSTLALAFPDRVVAPGWMWMSGTSFAAPVVSGIAARLLSIHPSWTPDQVKGALMATATGLTGGPQTGVGEVNAAAAASLVNPPSANGPLDSFVRADITGEPSFDGVGWRAAVDDSTWTAASWASASWASASWASASWASASWASASWASASWASASWASASWASADSRP
ncbi:MAG TPA: S8 family serine peptidase [Gaiellaceae bacterium]|nr:S8 family serine peptidase [Gaiellaceae bacterium]